MKCFEILFPCPVGDLQNVEPTLTKRVPPLFSKRRLLSNLPDETMSLPTYLIGLIIL